MDQTALRCCCGAPASFQPTTCTAREHAPGAPLAIHGKGRAAMLWGIGSTVLSVLGFLGWGLFEQYNSSLAELRADLKHFNESSSSFVKRDSMNRFREQAKEHFKEVQSIGLLKNRLEAELKASERAREEVVRELQKVRERLAFVEGQHASASTSGRGSGGRPVGCTDVDKVADLYP